MGLKHIAKILILEQASAESYIKIKKSNNGRHTKFEYRNELRLYKTNKGERLLTRDGCNNAAG